MMDKLMKIKQNHPMYNQRKMKKRRVKLDKQPGRITGLVAYLDLLKTSKKVYSAIETNSFSIMISSYQSSRERTTMASLLNRTIKWTWSKMSLRDRACNPYNTSFLLRSLLRNRECK